MDYNSSSAETHSIDSLIEVITDSLQAHPQGLSEYELIQIVKDSGYFEFLNPPPADPYELFRAHFLLFHALCQLRDRLWQSQTADLEIHTLKIKYLPYRHGETALSTPDALREYYLDLSQLESTTSREVSELIASFWMRLQHSDQRAEALKELGLVDPVDDGTITKTYRRMAMKHHPDRGGSKTRLQTLNRAIDILTKKT
jgi:DnaJ-domain-containing protein 1